MASFQFGYHVHEKAIMTVFVPLIPLAVCATAWDDDHGCVASYNKDDTNEDVRNGSGSAVDSVTQTRYQYKLLLWETSAWGLVGLFPLLFQPRELLLKWVSYVAYMCALSLALFQTEEDRRSVWQVYRYSTSIAVALTAIVVDAVPLSWWGRFEFAPLVFTSGACATGLFVSFLRLTYCMMTLARNKNGC